MPTLTPENPESHELKPSHIITSTDGVRLYLREWPSEHPSDKAVLIMHGLTAHSGPYEVMAEPIAKLGITTYGLDLRGHGLSGGNRGDIKGIPQFVDDMKLVLENIFTRHKELIILGHSLGIVTGLITLEYFPDNIVGLALLSGAREVKEGAYPERSLFAKLKILIWTIIRPSKPVVHYYREGIRGQDDPMFNFYYSLRFLRTLSAANITIPDKSNYPVFVGVGDKDELFSPEASRALLDEFDADDKHFTVFPDTYHSRFHDHSFDELFKWIKTRFVQG